VPASATFVVEIEECAPDAGVSTYSLDVTGTGVTAARFRSLSATATARGTLVRWRTGTEADVLGFQVAPPKRRSTSYTRPPNRAASSLLDDARSTERDTRAREGARVRMKGLGFQLGSARVERQGSLHCDRGRSGWKIRTFGAGNPARRG